MNKVRLSRISNAYMEQLNIIFGQETKNRLLKDIVVTSVSVSNDLSFAKVYYTCMNKDKVEVQKELEKSSGFFRSEIAKKVILRHTPELEFKYDTSIEYANHIEEIINKIHEKDTSK